VHLAAPREWPSVHRMKLNSRGGSPGLLSWRVVRSVRRSLATRLE
jgi:hypothetical protein